jgi:hypothetical protein
MTASPSTLLRGPGLWGRGLTVLSVLLFLFHAYVIVGFALMAGSHLLPAAVVLFFAGPIVCLLAVVVTAWNPIQKSAAMTNAVILFVYLLFWIPQIPYLKWEGW